MRKSIEMMGLVSFSAFFMSATLVLVAVECRAAFVINAPTFDFTNSGFNAANQTLAQNLFTSAENTWMTTLQSPPSKNVALTITKVVFSNALGGNGATIGASADVNGLPSTVNEMDISTAANMWYNNSIVGIGATQRDALSTMLHELGHAVGFNYLSGGDGYQKWNDKVNAATGKFTLAAAFGGGLVTLSGPTGAGATFTANDLSHVTPVDLMQPVGQVAVRQTISTLDIQMLQTAFGYVVPEPTTFTLLGSALLLLGGCRWQQRRRRRAFAVRQDR